MNTDETWLEVSDDCWDIDESAYRLDSRTLLSGDWVRIFGGGLTQPVDVRYRLEDSGRARIVGLKFDAGEVVTARTLREPRVSELERTLELYLREEREDLDANRSRAQADLARADGVESLGRARRSLAQVDHWDTEQQEAIARLTAELPAGTPPFRSRGRGAAPPTEDEYRAFALLFRQTQKRLRGRSPVSATARAAGMDRSTVYRWVEACRSPERQYLDPRESSDD